MARRGSHKTRNILIFATIINEIVSALALMYIFGQDSFNFGMFIASIIIGLIVSIIVGTVADWCNGE